MGEHIVTGLMFTLAILIIILFVNGLTHMIVWFKDNHGYRATRWALVGLLMIAFFCIGYFTGAP